MKKLKENVLLLIKKRESLILLWIALAVYVFTRFFRIEDFPVYFFTDEAAEQVRARELWHNFFFDEHGHFLPVTAEGPWFRFVSIAHYLQLPGWLCFGNTITVVRGTSILLTTWGVYGLARILQRHFQYRSWWLAPLVMLTMPAWFLHSRTAFECVYTVVFYIWFCHFYLDYIAGKMRSLYWAAVFGALTLYSYSAGPPVMMATAFLLLLSDAPYHYQNYRTVLRAFVLSCILLFPLALFFINYPDSPSHHVEIYSSVLSSNASFWTKTKIILISYSGGLTHDFWFTWKQANIRHQIKDLSPLLPVSAPLFYAGLAVAFYHLKASRFRLILVLMAASSVGSAFVIPEITRNMTFLVPAALLIMTGIHYLVQRIPLERIQDFIYAALFSALTLFSLFLTADCVKNAPYWFNNYTLFGLQWGSKEVVRDIIPDYLKEHPGEVVYLAQEWSNSPEYLLKFYNSPENFKLADIGYYMNDELPLPDATFVVTHQQYQWILQAKMLDHEDLGKVVYYPDGSPAFHFLKIKYSADAPRLSKEAELEKQKLYEEDVKTASGEVWKVRHNTLDMGNMEMLFDGNLKNLSRGVSFRAFVIETYFPEDKVLHGVEVGFVQENTLTAIVRDAQGKEIGRFDGKLLKSNPTFPCFRLDFEGLKGKARSVRLEMSEEKKEDAKRLLMHLNEITFY